jgi:hypothetical protein
LFNWSLGGLIVTYIDGIKSTPEDAKNLQAEIKATGDVSSRLQETLENPKLKATSFDKNCVLRSVIDGWEERIKDLILKFKKVAEKQGGKLERLMQKLKWPLEQQETEKAIEYFRRCAQLLSFSLQIESWYVKFSRLPDRRTCVLQPPSRDLLQTCNENSA